MPDFTAQGIEGLRADIITKGRAADRGGMKNGDIITAINGLPVRNIEEYMFRLSQLEPGQNIHVEVLRNEEKEILLIILE
jgi:S1-C subfamily serine protease